MLRRDIFYIIIIILILAIPVWATYEPNEDIDLEDEYDVIDAVDITQSGDLTTAGDATVTGTVTGGTLTDGTATITSGAITALSYIIGTYTLDTNEWQYLDGQDQQVQQSSDVTFNKVHFDTAGVYLSRDIAGNLHLVDEVTGDKTLAELATAEADTLDTVCTRGSTASQNITIDGSADEIQVTVQANTTQTADLVVFEKSDGTDVFHIEGDGRTHIEHTATANDVRTLKIDTNAAGFGDVKSVDIDYVTGAISAGEDEGIILTNINRIDSTGGDIFGHEVLATEGSAGVYGMKVGADIGPVHQDSGTFANPTTGTDNTVSTDVAAMIDGSTGTTTAIFENDNEYILIGAAAAFQEIEFVITTDSSGAGIAPTFGYSTAGSHQFTTFSPVDGTNGFRNTGIIAWDASDLTGHTTNDDTGTYDIKITRTRNVLSTSPVLGYAKTAATTEYIWDENGDVNIRNLTASQVIKAEDLYSTDDIRVTDEIQDGNGANGVTVANIFDKSADNLAGDVSGLYGATAIGANKILNTMIAAAEIYDSDLNAGTGANQINTADIPELTNLYYTEARVSANTDVTANTAKVTESTTVTSPLALATYNITIAQAGAAADGYLSDTDWNTFNNKVTESTTVTSPLVLSTYDISIPAATNAAAGHATAAHITAIEANTAKVTESTTVTAPLVLSTYDISIPVATTSADGYLSQTDWDTFNGKQAAGNYITDLTGNVTASGPGSVAATIAANAVINSMIAADEVYDSDINWGSGANQIDLDDVPDSTTYKRIIAAVAAGDMLYRNDAGAGTWGIITAGSDNDVLTMNGSYPNWEAGGAGAGDVTAAANLTDNAVVRGDGGAKGVQTSTALISDNGEMTNPSQPCFSVESASEQSDISTAAATTVVFASEIFDQNSDFAANTFTAPVGGKYLLTTVLRFKDVDIDATYIRVTIVTSNRSYNLFIDPGSLDADPAYWDVSFPGVCDLDANDTAIIQVYQSGGVQQTDINIASRFTGALLN